MKPSFEDLPRIEQLFWIDRILEMIASKGLGLMGEDVESAARRLYNHT